MDTQEHNNLGLTLVVGPPNSGKMGHALRWWQERLSQCPLIVTPTGPDAHGLTLEMVRRVGALVDVSPAVTFDGLIRTIVGQPLRHPDGFQRSLIIGRLLKETPLLSLGGVASMPGAGGTLARMLRQLDESGRERGQLSDILERWAAAEPAAAGLAADIQRLYEAYTEACAAWGLAGLPAAARAGLSLAADWARPVAFYGFTSFTSVQRALIRALGSAGEVLVTLSYEASRTTNLTTAEEVGEWMSIAHHTIELSPRMRAYSSPAVAYLERHFLSAGPAPEPPPASSGPEGVRFLLASGRRNEAELVAQQISALLRDGFRPGDIGVIVRRVHSWGRLLGQVFDSCGIPYHIDETRTFAETGFGHALLNLMRGILHDDVEGVLVYLRTPHSGIELETVADVELRYRRGAPFGVKALMSLLETEGARESPASLTDIFNIFTAGPEGPGIDLVALNHLVWHMLGAALAAKESTEREREEDAGAFRALAGALATLKQVAHMEQGQASLDAPAVMDALGAIPVPRSRVEHADAVQILSVQRARARRFQVVALLGLTEGEFPGHSDPPSFLTRGQRTHVDSLAGGGLFAPAPNQEAALFLSAVSRAWQLLLLSARDTEDGGGEVRPSRFWWSAKELLAVEERDIVTRSLPEVVFKSKEAPSHRAYLRACAAEGRQPHPDVRPEGRSTTIRRWKRPAARLEDPQILEEMKAARSFSPSALESYLTCPFAWFIEQVVGTEDLEPELDAQSTGQLLHRALARAYVELAAHYQLPLGREDVPEAERLTSAIIEDLMAEDGCPGSPADKRLAAWRLKAMARRALQMEGASAGALAMTEAEVNIGADGGADIGGLLIKGRVDRIDGDGQRRTLFVLDYKTGSIPKSKDIGGEGALQLPLYLMALAAERPGARVIGGAYLSARDGIRSGVVEAGTEDLLGGGRQGCEVHDQAGLEELFDRTRSLALGAAAAMRGGAIAPLPGRECPKWCSLGTVCRARVGGRW